MGTLPRDGSGEGRIGTPPRRLRHGYRRCISPGLSALATDLGPLVTHPLSPVIAGVEATGEVLEAGQGVALTPGTRVTVFLVDGAWRQEVTMDAELAVPVPDSHPDEIAAQMLVNPSTHE